MIDSHYREDSMQIYHPQGSFKVSNLLSALHPKKIQSMIFITTPATQKLIFQTSQHDSSMKIITSENWREKL